jgi:hypothetical protein
VHVTAMTLGSDWTLAGSIMTFAIPVGGFIVAATWLYFLYTRPHAVPGHRELAPVAAGAVGMGRHAAGAGGRHAVPPPPAGDQPSPPAQPPGGGTPGSGEGPGGYGGTGGR